MKSKKKAKSIAKLTDEAATLLQLIVRIKASDENGFVKCVTCSTVRHYKDDMAGGHFIERGRLATKLIERNINPQCYGCNAFGMKKASVVLRYRQWLCDAHGEEFVLWLEAESRNTKKYYRPELEDLISRLKQELSELDTRLHRNL